MLRGGPAACISVVAMALVSATARGDAPGRRVRLVYEAPAGCPRQHEFVASIAARVGYKPLDDAAQTGFSTRIRRDGKGFSAALEQLGTDERTPRTFASTDCRELVESVAVAIAMHLDPILGGEAPIASPAPVTTSHADPAPWREPDPFEKPAVPMPPAPARSAFLLTGGIAASIGLAPAPALGPRLGVEIRGPVFSLGVGGRADLGVATVQERGLDVSGSFVGVAVAPCARRGWAFACVEGALGRYEAVARGPDVLRSAAAFFALAGARLGGEVALHARATLAVYAFGAAPLTPMRLLVSNEAVWETNPVHFGLALTAGWAP